MAKRKKKKSSRRLTGAARKTVAALLMVTALIVAAIPGQAASAEQFHGSSGHIGGTTGDDTYPGHYKYDTQSFYKDDGLVYKVQSGTLKSVELRDDYDKENWEIVVKTSSSIIHVSASENSTSEFRYSSSEFRGYERNYNARGSKETVESITLPTIFDGLKSAISTIDAGVFNDFAGMTSLNMSDSVATIPANCFKNDTALQSVTGTASVRTIGAGAFEGLTNFKNFSESKVLTSIGDNAFSNSGISSFTFPETLNSTGIGMQAFMGSDITTVSIPAGGLKAIQRNTFRDCGKLSSVNLGGKVERIGNGAFEGCTNLSSISGLDSVNTIESEAFKDSGLTSFVFPDSLKTFKETAVFSGCDQLSSVTFPDEVKFSSFPSDTFKGCRKLKEIKVPEGITSMKESAFADCTGLETVYLPESLGALSSRQFEDSADLTKLYVYNKKMNMPAYNSFANDSLHIYGYEGSTAEEFANDWNISFVRLDDNAVELDYYTVDDNGVIVYADMPRLTASSTIIDIPSVIDGRKVTGIAAGVFQDNGDITEVVIPSTVKNIAPSAFRNCGRLKVVRFESDETNFGTGAFAGTNSNLILHGKISEDSEPFNCAMEQNLVFQDDDYGIVVEKDKETGLNTLIAYDENSDTLIVPTGVETFGEKGHGTATGTPLFDGNKKLENVQILGAIELKDHQFRNCSNLKSVFLPGTLGKIGKAPFYGCSSLSHVDFDGTNKKFECGDGIIYELTGSERTAIVESLPGYTGNNRYTIPSTVTSLYEEAFASPQNIGTVYFSTGVTTIPDSCFADSEIPEIYLTDAVHAVCAKAFADGDGTKPYLQSIHIPNSSTVIYDSATDGVTGLTVYGKKGSTAQYYADVNEYRQYKFVEEGDHPPGPDPSSSSQYESSSSSDSSSGSSSKTSTEKKSSSKKSSKKSSSKKSSKKSSDKKSSSKKSSSGSSSSSSAASQSDVVTTQGSMPTSNAAAGSAGNAAVDASDSGLDNEELISGSIDGGADNYVIKISRNDETTEAFEAALMDRYGSLDNLRYYPMDISLYDSTGTNKIEDPEGVSVTITIPIPEELALYGGNNHAAAVKDGELEELGTRFSAIDGTPCVTFTANHFSPYGLYVDVTNLTAGDSLDSSPKTGDPISPKWFLVVGLAALSIFLFMKKDPVAAPSAA